jgi:hypothetical protein
VQPSIAGEQEHRPQKFSGGTDERPDDK